MTRSEDYISRLAAAPEEPAAFEAWLRGEDALAFLKANARSKEFVVYAGYRGVFLHAVIVPASLLDPPDSSDLMSWNCNSCSVWSVEVSYEGSKAPSPLLVPPLRYTGSRTLDQGDQLVFTRSFDGLIGRKTYAEILQKFVHAMDLHFVHERNAYCRLDENGDIDEVVRIATIPGVGNEWGGTVVMVQRHVLDEYLVITNSAVVLTFDFTRYRVGSFNGWSNPATPDLYGDTEMSYRSRIETGNASYLRGYQIVRPSVSKEAIVKRLTSFEDENKKYESFIAVDWKTRTVREISCAPGATANYFTESDLPFELSPAFFRPEVLARYKADSEKFQLDERSIGCRNTWHLATYDINEAGQVHTYLAYLRDLPHSEQLHWKAHNEPPKALISRRAFRTDIEGEWFLEYDPLESLRHAIRELTRRQVPWWKLRTEAGHAKYPVTASADEWADELLHLDQLLVEGFEGRWLRGKAETLGRKPEARLGSVKLLEEYLIGLGVDENEARNIGAPFREVHHLRSKLKGHTGGSEVVHLRKDAIAEHKSYREHFRALCARCDDSMRRVAELCGVTIERIGDDR